MKIILTHPNADFDAVAASLAAHKLYPDATPVLPDRLNRNVNHFMMLYRSGLPFIFQHDFRANGVKQIILVDTQRVPTLHGLRKNTPVTIIDHHHPYQRDDLKPYETLTSEEVGATTTLLVERIQQQNIALTPLEATLLALGIYEDTGSLAYGTTTYRDVRAAAWLLEHNAALDTVRHFLTPPLNDEQQALLENLMANADSQVIQGQTIIVSTASVSEYIPEISSVVHQLRDTLDPAALFVLVAMPNNLLLVCRSTGEAIDVGEVARLYGGGGHDRAAAATIYDQTLEQVAGTLWQHIRQHIRPIATVADLMSLGVQTVAVDKTASQIAQQVRRIGHEGYPVVEGKRVVGLLTRRELDRALEHNLGNLKVRDIMTAGTVSLYPDDSVQRLEQTMVESGWGQIPILDRQNRLVGIVTRTDLINHWANTHPEQRAEQPVIAPEQMRNIMGQPVAHLIETVAGEARSLNLNMYLVGGAVRDLLLNRPNLDIDFVVESSAIDFAGHLRDRFGGDLHTYQPFGTAKWLLDDTVAAALETSADQLPNNIDFATTRNEFYEHPTALPTVYQGSIKLDLQRRDFTINTLAIQFSPEAASGRILDFYGGLNDLRNGLIRVLHSLSFVDDPTRILRAVRFEHRLGFKIEQRTAEHIVTALPMLRRTTGNRIRNELDLLLREEKPERALLHMRRLGILEAIHPAFHIENDIMEQFRAVENADAPWLDNRPDLVTLYWHALVTHIDADELGDFCERLMFGRRISQSLMDVARLMAQIDELSDSRLRPSEFTDRLDPISPTALLVVWLLAPEESARQNIERYVTTWQHTRPLTTGHALREMGLKPGPCYAVILGKLRRAWLDGDITSEQEEKELLQRLVSEEAACHDRT